MPVYKKHRLIHIHIPKTGGTAIEKLFDQIGDLTWGAESWIGQEYRNNRWFEYQHLSIAELHILSNDLHRSFESFAVVRNPYSRLISDYNWRNRISKGNPHAPVPNFNSFDAFIRAIPKSINDDWYDLIAQADQSRANFLIHTRPQYQYVLERGRTNAVDYILKFENLRQEIETLFSRFGLVNTGINDTVQNNILEYYDDSLIEIVNELYERDFVGFPYEML